MDAQKRKELKKVAKEAVPAMGIYRITNTVTGRCLLGSSMNLGGTANSYQHKIEFFSHHDARLKVDLERCGMAAFTFEVLETIDPAGLAPAERAEAVRELEKKWRAEFSTNGGTGYDTPGNPATS
ncbi:MAG TPA: GIY-YIG nuclease family protein [Candidatus Ozemobacteraceae bacterium]|nr:GIY-YIG nuclease family protein [Candidatus Ozemobacteraceae bacterium]HQG27162.1 GIY-YIG nuclease family protein [Candidatus Ozemobacteraceae bacterium]